MDRLQGLDAAFLCLETPTAHMHVTGVAILEPADDEFGLERFRRVIESRLHNLPAFRKRMVEVPLGLGHPVWAEDPELCVADHLHHIAAPAPGSDRELAEVVGLLAGRPLDRNRPLWEIWLVEGLEAGRSALVVKIHHAAIDGVASTEVMTQVFDLYAEGHADPRPGNPRPEADALPSPSRLLFSSIAHGSNIPVKFLRTVARTGQSLVPIVRAAMDRTKKAPHGAAPFQAPRVGFNSSITAERVVAFGSTSLDAVKRIKSAYGTTINNVILAACTQSLRRYLIETLDLPNRPLVAAIPVSNHSPGAHDDMGNRVSAMFVGLPVQLENPIEQLLAIEENAASAKNLHSAVGGGTLQEYAEFANPSLVGGGAWLYSRMKLADRTPTIHNLTISCVAGPPFPLYAAGARVSAVHPLGPILDGAGLNITVLSYADRMGIGVIACPKCVADPWAIAQAFEDAISTMAHEIAEIGID